MLFDWMNRVARQLREPKQGEPGRRADLSASIARHNLNETLNVAAATGKQPVAARSAGFATLLRRYLHDLAGETESLPWCPIANRRTGPDSGNPRLSAVYTPFDVIELEQLECEADARACMRPDRDMQRVPIRQMLDNYSRLVLLGDPGSGKTTLVNFLAHSQARACAAPKTEANRLVAAGSREHYDPIPIRIVLRDFAGWLASGGLDNQDLAGWIMKTLQDRELGGLWSTFQQKLLAGDQHFLILLDGLDEVPGDQRAKVVNLVDAFAEQYQHNRYLVTCGIHGYVDRAYRLCNFQQVVPAPFSDKQISLFIDAWYRELAARERVAGGRAASLAQRLKVAVKMRDLGGLTENPLLLTVMTLLPVSHHHWPEERIELYQWSVDLLLRRWKSYTAGESLAASLHRARMKTGVLESWLQHAAFAAHAVGAAEMSGETLCNLLAPLVGGNDFAADFLRYAQDRPGLLIHQKPGAYTFAHRLFQEFLAACHLAGHEKYASEAARLVTADPDLWGPVFVLAAGHAARTEQPGSAIVAVNKLCPKRVGKVKKPGKAAFNRAVIAAEALLEIGLSRVGRENNGPAVLKRICHWLRAALATKDVLEPAERYHIDNVFRELRDFRFISKKAGC